MCVRMQPYIQVLSKEGALFEKLFIVLVCLATTDAALAAIALLAVLNAVNFCAATFL